MSSGICWTVICFPCNPTLWWPSCNEVIFFSVKGTSPIVDFGFRESWRKGFVTFGSRQPERSLVPGSPCLNITQKLFSSHSPVMFWVDPVTTQVRCNWNRTWRLCPHWDLCKIRYLSTHLSITANPTLPTTWFVRCWKDFRCLSNCSQKTLTHCF